MKLKDLYFNKAINHPDVMRVSEQIQEDAFAFIKEFTLDRQNRDTLKDFSSGKIILSRPKNEQADLLAYSLSLYSLTQTKYEFNSLSSPLNHLCYWMLRRKHLFTEVAIGFVACYAGDEGFGLQSVKAMELYVTNQPLPPIALENIKASSRRLAPDSSENQRLLKRIKTLLGEDDEKQDITLQPGEAWADCANADFKQMDDATRQAWNPLISHCLNATGGKPKPKWSETAEQLVAEVGFDLFKESLLRWFPLVDKPRTQPFTIYKPEIRNHLISEPHTDILRGFVWCCSLFNDTDLTRVIGALGISSFRKVKGQGSRIVRLGNACIGVLGQTEGLEAVSRLAMMRIKVRNGSAQNMITKALTLAAEKAGVAQDELEEMAVPSYGFDEVGLYTETMGEHAAELRIVDTTKTELKWIKADGKTIKSIPAAVKAGFAEELKELRANAKDITKMLPALRDRIDRLHLAKKTWDYNTWAQRYLNHPIVGTLARRLIWNFTTGKDEPISGAWLDGQLVNSAGEPLNLDPESITVSLWHPIGQAEKQILAWREFFETREIRQPFKQAHREVYILTDAERSTEVYSNRYAAHIIKQHQFNALCAIRGWKNALQLIYEGTECTPTRAMPQWDLRAEFWVNGVGEEYGDDTNETGAFLYLATDQVRFYTIDDVQEPQPIPLQNIDPLVFSEVMRDVDLFVGVASVANDPNWLDGGREVQQRDYWSSVTFGDLSATAQTRKDLLTRLIPKLKIADQCSFDDKFLIVKGAVRTYRIHLGSGNILMEPNDQYLCIVPNASSLNSATSKIFLPFEGDRTLAIILSEAFLLADDHKIKDTAILSQIKR